MIQYGLIKRKVFDYAQTDVTLSAVEVFVQKFHKIYS